MRRFIAILFGVAALMAAKYLDDDIGTLVGAALLGSAFAFIDSRPRGDAG